MNDSVKTILLPTNEKVIKEKPKRKVTKEWSQELREFTPERSLVLVDELIQDPSLCKTTNGKELIKQCSYKRSSYLQQDIKKDRTGSRIISVEEILKKLFDNNLTCHYCREYVCLFYENIRDPKQWTLERIDNDLGHTNDNVVIACLSCNVRRNTMNEERYLFTKQLNIIKHS